VLQPLRGINFLGAHRIAKTNPGVLPSIYFSSIKLIERGCISISIALGSSTVRWLG
jgi:hypothetical protein